MPLKISLEDTVVAVKNQVAADVGGELIMLDLSRGEYFGLNEVGAKIWELIAEPRTVSAVRDQLLIEYPEVTPDRIEADLLSLLSELVEASLAEVVGIDSELPRGTYA